MLSSEVAVIKKLWTFFRTLGSWSLSVTAMLDFSGKANTSIHGLGEDDTATQTLPMVVVFILCSKDKKSVKMLQKMVMNI